MKSCHMARAASILQKIVAVIYAIVGIAMISEGLDAPVIWGITAIGIGLLMIMGAVLTFGFAELMDAIVDQAVTLAKIHALMENRAKTSSSVADDRRD